ncbi:MAG: hypothetical protein WBA51_07995 [Erythrobacter sp.]
MTSNSPSTSALRCVLMSGAGLAGLACLIAPATARADVMGGEIESQGQAGDPREDAQETDFGTDSGGGPGAATEPEGENQIVVSGVRLRGQLDVAQAPLLELGEEDIAAEGVASIADLVAQIQNQTGSARGRGDAGGRPVLLVNGIRLGSFRELFQYPPEALAKVEVFPEEVAQRFGFPPDRRVINLILKENYASREVEFEFEGPARGGQFVNEQELGYLKIADGGRINLNFTAQDTSLLTEAERDIIQTPGSTSALPGDPAQAEFRSLLPDTRSLEASVSWAKAFIDSGISVSANANYTRNDARRLQGLNTVTLADGVGNTVVRTFGEETPIQQITAQDVAEVAGSLTAPINAFRFTSTFDGGISETTRFIDNPFDTTDLELLALDDELPSSVNAIVDTAFTRTLGANTLNTLRGPLANLPGGELLATFDIGYDWTRLESADSRTLQEVQLTRGNISTGANFVIPITSRRNGFADALGSFTLNAQVGLDRLSDFGTLGDYNVSLNWAPTNGLDLSATYIYREVAPGLQNLGDPTVTAFNVPVFDFVNGETVLADVTTGGNPDLLAETQRDWKFAVNWELPFIDGTRFTVEYIRNRSDNVTSAFPQITQAIEAAFPDRITRNAAGVLTAVDQRSVNFGETRSDRLQFRLSKRGGFGGGERGGGRGGGRGGPPPGVGGRPEAGGPSGAGGPPEAGGPPGGGRRAAFMALRERLCADDGASVLRQLVDAVEQGEDVSAIVPGLTTERAQRIIQRASGGGELTDERLAAFRERLCSMDPAMFAGRGGGPSGDGAGPADGRRSEQFAALRERLCADDGLAEMRRIVGMIDRGEDVSALLPDMDPAFIKLALDRFRAEDGSIPDEALERFRTRICAADGAQGRPDGEQAGAGGPPSGGPAFNPLARGAQRGWRYFLNLTHTIELENEIRIAPGVPVLDQLDGDATGAFGFPRHSSRLEAGLFGNGLGTRLSAQYTGSTRLNGSGLPGSSDLFFDDLATFDIRVFTNLDQITGSDSPVLKNMRISLRMDNIFDAQRAVRDEAGETPINYQPFVIDPVGRFIGIDIRKLF